MEGKRWTARYSRKRTQKIRQLWRQKNWCRKDPKKGAKMNICNIVMIGKQLQIHCYIPRAASNVSPGIRVDLYNRILTKLLIWCWAWYQAAARNLQTVICFGLDGISTPTIRGAQSAMELHLAKRILDKAKASSKSIIVTRTDEYKTSQICPRRLG